MKKQFGILLVVAALVFGYFGYTKLDNSQAEIKVGDLEISARDSGSQQTAYILFGLAAVSLIAGFVVIREKS
ncbi:MAG TPA: hypothetical protein VI603_02110 [Saprospiraceae bacterium]|nr:hypothetical protein [Saprospiraceae bacterium]